MPYASRHQEYSTIAFVENDASRASKRLVDVAVKAIDEASKVDLTWVSQRITRGEKLTDIWPGEHYRLLAGLVAAHNPKRIVEVGTFKGLSALCMKGSLQPGAEIITVDIVPWREITDTAFLPQDFEDGQLKQAIGDLSNPEFFESFTPILSNCDLLFVDGPKNVVFEEALLRNLARIKLSPNVLVLFDDTRQWNMLRIWHEISRPKLDLTSFGHWTGTGLVDWNG